MSFDEILEKIHNKEKVDFSEMIRGGAEAEYTVSHISATGHYRIDTRINATLVRRENFPDLQSFNRAFHSYYSLSELQPKLFFED